MSFCHFPKDDILRIINNLDPNKAHGHDKVSIRMLKYVVIQFGDLLAQFLIHVYVRVSFPWN